MHSWDTKPRSRPTAAHILSMLKREKAARTSFCPITSNNYHLHTDEDAKTGMNRVTEEDIEGVSNFQSEEDAIIDVHEPSEMTTVMSVHNP